MELLAVVGALLPLGLAAALSSVPIAVAIAILLSRRAAPNGLAYLVGQLAGVLALTAAIGSGLSLVPRRPFDPHHVVFGAAEITIGVLLVAYGIYRSLRSPRAPRSSSRAWKERLAGIGPLAAVAIGLGLNLRPKAILLALAAGLAIGSGDLTAVEALAAAAIYALLATSAIAGAVVAHLLRPAETARSLEAARAWLARHGRLVTVVVTILIGVVVLGNGLVRIAG